MQENYQQIESLEAELQTTQIETNHLLECAVLKLIKQHTLRQYDLPDNALDILSKREELKEKIELLKNNTSEE
jgi:hypothetical protein